MFKKLKNNFDIGIYLFIVISCLLFAEVFICSSVKASKNNSEDINVFDKYFNNFAQINDNLYYDKETKIVYLINCDSSIGNFYGVVTPYIAPNGLPYVFNNGEMHEIKCIEKSVKVIEYNKETIKEVEKIPPKTQNKVIVNTIEKNNEVAQPDGVLTKTKGVNWYQGHKETYYNLDMTQIIQNAQNKGISGDYWIREDGCKMLGNYIMIAANYNVYPYGSIVETSLGSGIVVDTGDFAIKNIHQIDISVNW